MSRAVCSTTLSTGEIAGSATRCTRAFLHARFLNATWSESRCTVLVETATSANAVTRSRSWNAPRPRTFEETWLEIPSTGARSTLASYNPVSTRVEVTLTPDASEPVLVLRHCRGGDRGTILRSFVWRV